MGQLPWAHIPCKLLTKLTAKADMNELQQIHCKHKDVFISVGYVADIMIFLTAFLVYDLLMAYGLIPWWF